MNLTEAKSLNSRRSRKKRVGRGMGSGMGKTSGRGHKGARSRSGWSSRGMSGGQTPLFRRLPKVGFSNAPFKTEYVEVNLDRLRVFDADTNVTPLLLQQKGIIKQLKNRGVKVLGSGEVDVPLAISAHAFSASAKAKIESAGGSVQLIAPPRKPVRNKMRPARAAAQEA